jgi:hypothetical protein
MNRVMNIVCVRITGKDNRLTTQAKRNRSIMSVFARITG